VEESEKVMEKVRTSELLRIYGGLLSEKQAQILRLYFDEDLGYSEIAEELGITRQAVYDATQQGKQALEKYERHLGLLRKQHSNATAPEAPTPASPEQEADPSETQRIFASVEKMAGEDIIYDTRRLRLRLKELRQKLWPRETVDSK